MVQLWCILFVCRLEAQCVHGISLFSSASCTMQLLNYKSCYNSARCQPNANVAEWYPAQWHSNILGKCLSLLAFMTMVYSEDEVTTVVPLLYTSCIIERWWESVNEKYSFGTCQITNPTVVYMCECIWHLWPYWNAPSCVMIFTAWVIIKPQAKYWVVALYVCIDIHFTSLSQSGLPLYLWRFLCEHWDVLCDFSVHNRNHNV